MRKSPYFLAVLLLTVSILLAACGKPSETLLPTSTPDAILATPTTPEASAESAPPTTTPKIPEATPTPVPATTFAATSTSTPRPSPPTTPSAQSPSKPTIREWQPGLWYVSYVPGYGLDEKGTVNFVLIPEAKAPPPGQGLSGTGPNIIRLPGGQYRMYYTGNYDNSGDTAIVSATSTDAIHWTPDPGIRVRHGSSPTDGDYKAQFPSVVFGTDGKYHMVYQGNAQGEQYRQFFAISDDSLTWTKQDYSFGDPAEGNPAKGGAAGKSTVTVIDGKYHLFYASSGPLRRAESSDFINWQPMGIATRMGVDPGGIILVNGTYYMTVEGWANSPPPTEDDPEATFLIVSSDGIHWSNDAYRVMLTLSDGTVTDLNIKKFGYETALAIAPDGSVILYHDDPKRVITSSSGIFMFGMKLASPLPKASATSP